MMTIYFFSCSAFSLFRMRNLCSFCLFQSGTSRLTLSDGEKSSGEYYRTISKEICCEYTLLVYGGVRHCDGLQFIVFFPLLPLLADTIESAPPGAPYLAYQPIIGIFVTSICCIFLFLHFYFYGFGLHIM